MPMLDEYGRRYTKKPAAPATPVKPRPPGHGALGGNESDYGAPAAPPATPTSPGARLYPGQIPGLMGDLNPHIATGNPSPSAGERLYPGLIPSLTPKPLRTGPTVTRGNLVGQGHPLGASDSDYGALPALSRASVGNVAGTTPTAATAAQSVLRAAGASQPTTTQSPAVTQQQQTTGGPVTPTAPATTSSQSQTPAGTDYLSSLHQDLQSELASVQSDSNAAITTKSQYYQQLMDLLEQTKKDLIAQSEADGKQLDPATVLSLDRLKQDAQDNLKAVREAANRRGILDSGIALGMEQNSNKAYGDQESQILSDRLTRIQQGLQDSLRQLSGQAISVQQAKTADLSGMQDKLFQSLQNARQQGQQRQDSLMQWNAQREDNAAARNAQLAINLSQMSGNVVTPVSQADQLLAQAKQQWNEANARGDQQGMAAAAELGRQARAMGPTLDPNNTMTYDQLMSAINQGGSAWNQVQQGSQTYQKQQNAQKVLQSAMGNGGGNDAQQAVANIAQFDLAPEYSHLTPVQKAQMVQQWADTQLSTGQMSLAAYNAAVKEIARRYPSQQDANSLQGGLGQ